MGRRADEVFTESGVLLKRERYFFVVDLFSVTPFSSGKIKNDEKQKYF
jgi:hypothetical protein